MGPLIPNSLTVESGTIDEIDKTTIKKQKITKASYKGHVVHQVNLTKTDQNKIKKAVDQYRAAVETFNKYPYRTEGFSHSRCAKAVIAAYKLDIYPDTIYKAEEICSQTELKKLDSKVKKEYEKLKAAGSCVKPDVISINEFLPEFRQIQALYENYKDQPDKEWYFFKTVIKCFNTKGRLDPSKPCNALTLKRYYDDYIKESKLTREPLHDDVREEFLNLITKKGKTQDDIALELKKPLQQFKALKDFFGNKEHYSEIRCASAVLAAYDLSLGSISSIKKYFAKYEELYGEKCPELKMPEQKAIDAYNELAPENEVEKSKTTIPVNHEIICQYKAALEKYKDTPSGFSSTRCAKAVIDTYELNILPAKIINIFGNAKEIYGHELETVSLEKRVEKAYEALVPAPHLLLPKTTDSMDKFIPAFKQFYALSEEYKNLQKCERNRLSAVITCLNLKGLADQTKPFNTATLKRYYDKYIQKNALEIEPLRDDIKAEFLKLMRDVKETRKRKLDEE